MDSEFALISGLTMQAADNITSQCKLLIILASRD
jgi:hypothetical protein